MASATENIIMIDTIEYDVVLDTLSGAAGEKTLFTRNGDRKPVNLKKSINFANGYGVNNAVLTLLNIESSLYSLSIKIKVDKSIKVLNLISLNFINNRLYSSKTETYKDPKLGENLNNNLSHVLFIGNVKNAGDGNFKIAKTILITNDETGEAVKHLNIGGEEEYLNLHHIDYFSFMYDDFIKMYDIYKVKNERQQNPDSRKKINNAATAATAVLATTKLRKPIRPLPKVQPAAAAARKEEEPREEDEDEDEDKEEDEDKDKEEDEDKDKDKATASRDQAAADGARDEAAGAARKEEKAPRDEDEDKDKDKATAARDQSAADGARDEAALQVKPAALQVKPAAPVVEQVAQEPTQQPTGEIQEGEMGGGKKKLRKPKPKKPKKSK